MPKATPLPDWTGEDVYLLGGGPSIRSFDFGQLRAMNVIGCNQAFLLGEDICHVAVFGDFRFWTAFCGPLEKFGGWVATNYKTACPPAWLRFYPRQTDGLGDGRPNLAWNGNTGALAVNLALVLGAKQVFLLGFDMGTVPGRSHWHDARIEVPTAAHYERFQDGFGSVAAALPRVFPGRRVFNVTDGSSRLLAFPCINFETAGLRPPVAVPEVP